MNHVYKNEGPRPVDRCQICGGEIPAGTVFVINRYRIRGGGYIWSTAHLVCNARRRQLEQERQRDRRMLGPTSVIQ